MSKALAAKLTRLRKQLGMNQTELGKALGVSQGAISVWELNKGEPKRENLVALAELADVPLIHLLDEKTMNKSVEINGIIFSKGQIADAVGGYTDTVIAAPDGLNALRIDDETMAPFKEGWLLMYLSNRTTLEKKDIDELSVIGMAGHGRRVGFVRYDRSSSSYWVEPLGGGTPIFNPKITYVNPIIAIQTR